MDLIDELLERDAGTVNSTIIGMSLSGSWMNLAEDSVRTRYITELSANVLFVVISVGRSGEDESQEDVLMDEAPSNISQASTLQANREGKTAKPQSFVCFYKGKEHQRCCCHQSDCL